MATRLLGHRSVSERFSRFFRKRCPGSFCSTASLLQEYEELLINESEAGHRISEAIERILGVPILKRGRIHLTQLSEEADKLAAKEASKRQETQALGNALQQSAEQKEAHHKEVARLQDQLKELSAQRAKLSSFFSQHRNTQASCKSETRPPQGSSKRRRTRSCVAEIFRTGMGEAWRSLLREPVRTARALLRVTLRRRSTHS